MSGEIKKSATISAIPFQFVFLLYCVLFGIILRESGVSTTMVLGVVVFLGGLGLMGLDDFREKDVPMAVGGMYLAGVMVSLLLFLVVTSLPLVTAIVLGGLFVAGVVGNVYYFLSENQKLAYLNGQIAEEGLTLRWVGRVFPLWLVVGGNILLVFLITPLLFGSLYSVAGPYQIYLFEVQTKPTLVVWFVFLIENLNQSLLGVASLLGISFPGQAVVPVGLGRLLVAIFRLGILSLGLGAVKRYLDLRATTRRLMLALGRSGLEQEQWECRNEGHRVLNDKEFQEFENRRQMWQLRLRQLIQLYPAQLDRLVSEVTGRGDWRLRLDAKLYPSKEDPLGAKHLGDWIRAELAELLGQGLLYESLSAERQVVMRTFLQRLQFVEGREALSARVSSNVGVSLARLLRASDSDTRRENTIACLRELVLRSDARIKKGHQRGWLRLVEARSRLASTYALLLLHQREELVQLLPAFQNAGSALSIDVNHYVADLAESWAVSEASILSAVERLLTVEDGENPAPFLAEISHSLRQLPPELRSVYQLFVAKALVSFWYLSSSEEDEALLQPTSRLLMLCGEKNATQAVWRIVQTLPLEAWGHQLIGFLVEGHMASVLGSFFRHKLGSRTIREQELAADLMTAIPATPKNSDALCQMVAHERVAYPVRWRGLCSLATLEQGENLPFLQDLQFSEVSQPRLWAAWIYAKACCGEAEALPLLLDTLIEEDSASSRYQAIREVLADRRAAEVDAICISLNSESDNEERLEACETLVGCQSPLALPILGRLVKDPDTAKKIRQSAAEDLGILGRSIHADQMGLIGQAKSPAEWAAEPLLYALEHDKDRLVRIRAARALGRLGLPEIRQRFQEALVDPSENAVVRQVVAQAVGEMGDVSWMDFLLERYPKEKSAQVRQGMLSALDRLGADASFFLDCLTESNAKILQLSLQALANRYLLEEQQHALLEFLHASHKDVRSAAAETLGAQGYTPAIPVLCALLNHEEETQKAVRRAAIRALRKLARTPSQKAEVRPFLELVFNEDPDHLVIQDCASALAHLFKEEIGPLLLHALQHREEREVWMKGFAGIVRALGASSYSGAEDYLFDQLRKLLKAEKLNVARIIAMMRPTGVASGSKALPLLFEIVKKNSEAFSWVAVQVMAEIGDPQIIKPLQQFMEYKRSQDDLEPNLEAVILVTLVRMGEWDYLEELVHLLRDTSHEREVARRRALGVLPELQVDLSSLLLLKAMSPQHTPHEKIRETAVKSLGRMVAAIDHRVQALQWQAQADPRAKIREAAQSALRAIESRTSRSLEKFQDGKDFYATSKLEWDKQPLHPVWQEQLDARRQSHEATALKFVVPGEEDVLEPLETLASLDAPDPSATSTPEASIDEPAANATEVGADSVVEEPTAEVKELTDTAALSNVASEAALATEAALVDAKPEPEPEPEPEPPSFEELMVAAFLQGNEQDVRELAASEDAKPKAPLWNGLIALMDDLALLRERFDENWLLVSGNPKGIATKWPFLVMRQPVSQRDYLEFCEKTDRPLPRRWSKTAVNTNPTAPATNLKWWDAVAYAEYHGWQLPTHDQLMLTFGNYELFSLEGNRVGWMLYPDKTEWTATPNTSRRQLVRAYTTDSQPVHHIRRDSQSFEVGFRCCISLDARLHPVISAFLLTGGFAMQNLLAYYVGTLGFAMPEEPSEWSVYLEQWSPEEIANAVEELAAKKTSSVSEPVEEVSSSPSEPAPPSSKPESVVVLHDTATEDVTIAQEAEQARLAAEQEAEQARLAAAQEAEQVRLAAEQEAEEAERRRLEEEAQQAKEAEQQSKLSHFWSSLDTGAWDDAALWFGREGSEHFEASKPYHENLTELCNWLREQRGMVWIQDKDTEGEEPILLLQEQYVSRGDFHRFCHEMELPMSPRWRGGARISSPLAPATDISVMAAREYASSVGAELPSLEQLKHVVRYDFFHRTLHELTRTHYPNNARLYYSFDLTAAHENNKPQRTLRRDEPAAKTSFRVCRTIHADSLPELLVSLMEHLPPAFPVDSFPYLLGPALRVHLSHRLSSRASLAGNP